MLRGFGSQVSLQHRASQAPRSFSLRGKLGLQLLRVDTSGHAVPVLIMPLLLLLLHCATWYCCTRRYDEFEHERIDVGAGIFVKFKSIEVSPEI